jgi:AraC-like DNA-binding protein
MKRASMGGGIYSAIRQVILDLLPNGYPSITSVAAMLGISPRTLQRRLAEAGLAYGQFVAQVRFELARRELKDPFVKMGKLSRRLGYRDPSSFSRAFTRWSGMSPSQYRQQLIRPAGHHSLTKHP